MATNNPSEELYDFLTNRNLNPTVINVKTGQPPVNDQGKFDVSEANNFSFDYVPKSGKNYGAVEILITPESLLIASGDNVGRSMEEQDKNEWFDQFLPGVKSIATRHNLKNFEVTNLPRLKIAKQSMAALSESFVGNKRYSFTGSPTEARLMIKHSKVMGEGDQRFRYIESIFIETADGERFKLKTRSLVEGRAQLQHVKQGGRPWDDRGQHISEMVEQAKVLSQFRRAHHGKVFEGEAQVLISETEQFYESLRQNIKRISTASGYRNYFETWNPNSLSEQDIIVEDLKDLFIETKIDPRIEQALPLLAQIKENKMKEIDIFETWAEKMVEGAWEIPETPEQINKLKTLMSKPLPAGPDGMNATEQLYNLIGDDELFDRIEDLANEMPDADVRDLVKERLIELGIDIDFGDVAAPAAEQPPVEEPPVEEPVPIEPGMAEDNTPGGIGFMKENDITIERLKSLAFARQS